MIEIINPRVSIIIPVYNDIKRLEKCLDALKRQTYNKDFLEIIVVDNNSTQNIESLVKKYSNFAYILERKKGSYAARNTGIKRSSGEVIGFTDSDCIPSIDWIEQGVKNISIDNNIGLLAGKVELFYKKKGKMNSIEVYEYIHAFPQKFYVENQKFGVTANVFTKKEIIKNVGLFKEELKSGGDHEWGNRVHENGFKLLYSDDVLVKHPARSTFKQIYKKHIRVKQGQIDLNSKNKKILFTKNKLIDRIVPREFFSKKISGIQKVKYIFARYVLKILLLGGDIKLFIKNFK